MDQNRNPLTALLETYLNFGGPIGRATRVIVCAALAVVLEMVVPIVPPEYQIPAVTAMLAGTEKWLRDVIDPVLYDTYDAVEGDVIHITADGPHHVRYGSRSQD